MEQLPVEQWSHIVIRVSDIERSYAWYQEVLGFETIFDVELGGEGLEEITGMGEGIQGRMIGGYVGGQRVELMTLEGQDGGTYTDPSLGIAGFTLKVSDADKAYEIANRNGIEAETPPVEILGYRQFFIRDPDGVHIELTQYPEGAAV